VRLTQPISKPREMTPAELIRDRMIYRLDFVLRFTKDEKERIEVSKVLDEINHTCPNCAEKLNEITNEGREEAQVVEGYWCNCGWGEKL